MDGRGERVMAASNDAQLERRIDICVTYGTDGAAAATLVTYSRRNKDTAEIEWTAAARVITASNDAQ